jgi:hypothetical protein
MTPATVETPAHQPRIPTPTTRALFDVIEAKSAIVNVPMLSGGTAAEIDTQRSVWRQVFVDCLARIPTLGEPLRDREVQQAALACRQYEESAPMARAAHQAEADKRRRDQEAEEARQARVIAELEEENRLKCIALGIGQ